MREEVKRETGEALFVKREAGKKRDTVSARYEIRFTRYGSSEIRNARFDIGSLHADLS
jgi:hypothetical protein